MNDAASAATLTGGLVLGLLVGDGKFISASDYHPAGGCGLAIPG